jgi:hypothetical protein
MVVSCYIIKCLISFDNVFLIFAGLRLHSHRLIIFQPSFFNAVTAFASLAILPFILFSHHSVLVLGTTKYLQFLCPCQKQPCTNIMVLYFGKTISGLPVIFYRVAGTGSRGHVKIFAPAFRVLYSCL